MAAGRYGGYRSAEFGERESNHSLPQRELSSGDRGDDGSRNASRRNDLNFRDRAMDSGRVRQKDIKERESLNGDYTSSSRSDSGASSGGGGGRRRCGNSVRIVDREPGELSSESGSDGAVESESQLKDILALNMENGSHSSPVTRKRKFSPIVWDRDVQEVKGLSKGTKLSPTSGPLLPSLPKKDRPAFSSIPCPSDNLHASPVTIHPETSLSRGSEENVLEEIALSEVPGDVHDQSEQPLGNNEEAERQKEEDYMTTRNISSSRWAGDADSPADEGEIFGDEDFHRERKTSSAKLLETSLNKRSTSTEPMELKKESFDRSKIRTSNVEGGVHSRPSSGDRGSENGVDGDDFMEVDNEKMHTSSSSSRSDTDSEDRINYSATPQSLVPPQRTVNMLQGCRSVDEFERLNKIDEGTYGVVYRARDKKTCEIVALKKVKMEKEREGFPLTSLREINILLSFHHPSIVDVKEVVVGSSLDSIFMAMEYMEHDLKALMETMKQPFSQSEVKCLMLQLLEGIKYLHDNWVLHRDLKTSNLLLNNRGELKICDFGLARQYGSPLKPYTRLVVTLWYRAPELLLGARQYSTAIDMWSLGCIMAEMLSKEPLFNGKAELDQIDKIFKILGTPNEDIWPGFSKLPDYKVNFVKHQYNQLRKKFPATSFTGSPVLSDAGFDLLNKLLTYDPEKRITAEDALRHEWFREVPLPKSKEFMPTFPAQHARDRRMRRVLKSPDPLEEQRKREMHQAEFGTGGLFG